MQAAANYPVETYVMENEADCPAAHLCYQFTKGDIKNFDDVYNFGKNLNAITIEIESVNEDALEKLEKEGVKIIQNLPHYVPSKTRSHKNNSIKKRKYQR